MSSAVAPPLSSDSPIFDRVATKAVRTSQALTFLSWVGVTGIAAYLTPSHDLHGTHQELGLPPCPSVLLFDRPCPGCGLTTSWTALIHGNLPMALHAHAFGPLLYLAYTIVSWLGAYAFLKGWRVRTEARWFQATASVIFTLVIVYGAIRFALTPHYGTAWERSLLAVPHR